MEASNEITEDNVEDCLVKPKRVRSDKQIAAFENAQRVRLEKAQAKKEEKEMEIYERMKEIKGKKVKVEKVEEEVDEDSESEEEEEEEYVPKRKCLIKPEIPKTGKKRPMFKTGKKIQDLKTKAELAKKKKKKAVVVYLDSSDEDEDEESDYDSDVGYTSPDTYLSRNERVKRYVEKEFNPRDHFC